MSIQRFYELMLSNEAMGISIMLVTAVFAFAQRIAIGALFEEDDRFWKFMLRATAVISVLTMLWITISDSWLQLVTDPYRLAQRWDYQRTIFDPVDVDERRITLGLSLLAALSLAALFARYVGGYALQLGGLVVAIFGWFALFILRQRFDMIVNTVPASNDASLVDALGFLGFWLLRTSLGIVSIGLTGLVIVLVVAPLMTLALDLLKLRHPRMSADTSGFFAALERTAATYEDIPLSARWKPIRARG